MREPGPFGLQSLSQIDQVTVLHEDTGSQSFSHIRDDVPAKVCISLSKGWLPVSTPSSSKLLGRLIDVDAQFRQSFQHEMDCFDILSEAGFRMAVIVVWVESFERCHVDPVRSYEYFQRRHIAATLS